MTYYIMILCPRKMGKNREPALLPFILLSCVPFISFPLLPCLLCFPNSVSTPFLYLYHLHPCLNASLFFLPYILPSPFLIHLQSRSFSSFLRYFSSSLFSCAFPSSFYFFPLSFLPSSSYWSRNSLFYRSTISSTQSLSFLYLPNLSSPYIPIFLLLCVILSLSFYVCLLYFHIPALSFRSRY